MPHGLHTLHIDQRTAKSCWRRLCLQEELEDVMHWQKQITAVLLGLIWAIIPLTGLQGIAT